MQQLGLDIDGTVLGQTRLSAVDGSACTLSYCGYDFHTLASHATWEEVVYLLWSDTLPTTAELASFRQRMATARPLDAAQLALLQRVPTSGHGMDAVRSALSLLGQHAQPAVMEGSTLLDQGLVITAQLPTIAAALIRLRAGHAPLPPDPTLSHAANFLWMLHGTAPDPVAVQALDTYMVVLAENGLNISTFVAAVVASTRNDLYSAIIAGLATLKGLAHGGANEQAMQTFLAMGAPERAAAELDAMIARKQRLMGVGHRIFAGEDPRVRHLRQHSAALAARATADPQRSRAHAIAETVAAHIETHPFFVQRGLHPNVEFYSAPLLYQLGFPLDFFTVAFACARTPGWIAHIAEQLTQPRLVRPEATYVGEQARHYVPLAERGSGA